MKALILAALVALGLGVGTARAATDLFAYQTPSHNYHQNNWMNG
jgi:hypothetical protein